MLFTADLKAFAEKEVKVKTSATTKKTTVVKKEEEQEGEELEIGAEYEGVMKQEIEVKIVGVKREKRLKAGAKDDGEDGGSVGVAKSEKKEWKIEMEIKGKGDEENQHGMRSITVVKKGRGEKVESMDRAPKQILGFGDELYIELELTGMTMADRIKRRRRR